jgi:hypothetical protein
MNKIFILILAIIVILGIILVIPVHESNEIRCSFGFWKIGLSGNTTSGEKIPFSITNTLGGQLLSVFYSGTEITSVTYYLQARATGEGYTICELDLSSITMDSYIYNVDGGCSQTLDKNIQGDSAYQIMVDHGYETVMSLDVDMTQVTCGDGTYKLELRAFGPIRFRGVIANNEYGSWQNDNVDIITKIDITIDTSDDGNGGEPPPGDQYYDITVYTVPRADWVTCEKTPGSNVYEKKYPTPSNPYPVFRRKNGVYKIEAFRGGALKKDTATVNNNDVSITIQFTLNIIPKYTISTSDMMIHEYRHGDNYLGWI